jgi:hypothetical protein
LIVSDGAKTAKLTLIGAYATSDFVLSDDSQGGTFVEAQVAQFAQTMAGFAPAGGALPPIPTSAAVTSSVPAIAAGSGAR